MQTGFDNHSLISYDDSMNLPPEVLAMFREVGREGGRKGGLKGGRARVKKGFACMFPEKRRAAIAKSIATRRAHKLAKAKKA